MKEALGLVEIQGLSTAIVAADTMAKAANIRILMMENTKGEGYMTIKVAGDVGAVNAAVSAGKQIGMEHQKLVSWNVIARPSVCVESKFCTQRKPEKEQTEPEKPSAVSKPEEIEEADNPDLSL